MKLIDKIHAHLQKLALEIAIEKLVGTWGDYYITDDNNIRFDIRREKIKELETLEFNLPSCAEIKAQAKKIYRKFDDSSINRIIYTINLLNRNFENTRDLILTAKEDTDILIDYSAFKKVDIQSEGKVSVWYSSSDSDINIKSKEVEIVNVFSIAGDINITAEYVSLNSTVTLSKDLIINSQMITFNYYTDVLGAENIKLQADMIDCKDSKLKAKNKIEITNTNCNKVEGVHAPIIIYNGQDISYSEGILVPKLRSNLIDVLYKVRKKVRDELKSELEIETENLKEELNNKPIVKMLKK